MTEIFGKEKKIEQVNVLLSSESLNIDQLERKDEDQSEIKKSEEKIDELIRIKSTEDPFKFIVQNKQGKNKAKQTVEKPEVRMYRQGDILFKKIHELPERLKEKPDNIVAGGEGSTHAHMLVNGDLFQVEHSNQKYIRTREDTRLIHEEHLPIRLEDGIYEVVRQREYLGPGLVKVERFVVD